MVPARHERMIQTMAPPPDLGMAGCAGDIAKYCSHVIPLDHALLPVAERIEAFGAMQGLRHCRRELLR
jgi:hypothetical protein